MKISIGNLRKIIKEAATRLQEKRSTLPGTYHRGEGPNRRWAIKRVNAALARAGLTGAAAARATSAIVDVYLTRGADSPSHPSGRVVTTDEWRAREEIHEILSETNPDVDPGTLWAAVDSVYTTLYFAG